MAAHTAKKRCLNPLNANDEENGDKGSSNNSSIEDETIHRRSRATKFHTEARPHDLGENTGKNHASRTSLASAHAQYGSSILKLQVEELLTKLRKDSDRKAIDIENALRKLKTVIEHIPSREATPIFEAERKLQTVSGTSVPFPEPRPGKEAKYLLAYAEPENINIVGSYARKTTMRSSDGIQIDLAVTMPSTIFQEKDYLNYRYFHKRAYYLACLASGIRNANDYKCSMSYAYQNGNPLQPIILIDPDFNDGHDHIAEPGFRIRIILAAREDLFPKDKIQSSKNCVRIQKLGGPAANPKNLPTLFYNASLRSECCTFASLKLLHASSTRVEAFGDTCRLGSLWLRQRGFGTDLGRGGFGQSEWAFLLALLLHEGGVNGKPVLSKGYSCLQMFKATLQFLAARDLVTNPLLIGAVKVEAGDDRGPVLFDGQRGINFLFKMTAWSYKMLCHEARTTVQTLSVPLADQFESLFISKVDFVTQRFDSILRLCIPRAWRPSNAEDATDRTQAICRHVCEVLSNGLGDRIKLICPLFTSQSTWSTDSPASHMHRHVTISIGLLSNPDQAFRTVDHGPATESKAEAATFRQFWGEKADLRRFKDGSILETLIWAQESKVSIIEQIIRYVIRRHMGSEALEGLRVVDNVFNGFIPDPGPPNVSPEMLSAFETLEKDIRSIEGLPLQIRQINAASAELRYASLACGPNTPLSQRLNSKQPADVCVQFEGSTRWPNDMAAVQRTKIAFLLKMGELLESNIEGLAASVGLENEKHRLLNSVFLDIIYPNGAAFRVRIHHERELNMLEGAFKDKTTEVGKREDVAFAVSAYKRTFVQVPAHTQAVRTLCTRYPLLSPSMRLMKRWRDSHLLSGHISDELIELLIIRTFVTPYPYQAPGSLMTAFLRTLNFISKWDWHIDPLIVDFSGAMNTKDIDAVMLRFEGWRRIDPAMNRIAMFAASDIDREGITWTEHSPSKVVAARFTALARAACNLAKEQELDIEPEALFTPSMAEYDFVICLNARFTKGKQGFEKKKKAFKNLQLENSGDTSLIGYNPIQLYIEELRSMYGGSVLFFHDTGGSEIAGLWNPHTGARPWKVNIPYPTIPAVEAGEEKISINKAATLHDIASLGGDMIFKVEVR